ncbi:MULTISPECIES: alkaline phosphatase family protein [Ruegeria]|uniref:alkaline phosphatase family protein n=1 Tax=Ruegeria TaxID=97050 RepID=UPI0014817700|nr:MULTISPECIES: alkaline phosphatase family protein [Ruegeria]NOD64915.1 alkaline phosphatase family protein [Ruegeria sp. HKCCD6109]
MLRFWLITLSMTITAPALAQEAPKLILQLTVDQLRGDLIQRYSKGMGEDGFFRLINEGVHYADAHHRHANTETIVGHTTLATGADPSVHGMVANLWFDRVTGQQFYNVQDADYPLVGASGVDKDSEIDPTQRAATTDGRSPRSIITSTISDEIALHYGPEAKIFGVSVKDRGAISMAGHAGQAYWFSKSDYGFVTSTYYREDYPDWVEEWNDSGKVRSYEFRDWNLLLPEENYLFANRDNQEWETIMGEFGRVFPHSFGPADGDYYTTLLTISPAGDALTLDFAKALIEAEDIGQDDVPDYLAVSLSSTDYVGHIFGPSSLESEDNLKHLDKELGAFLTYVDETIGLDNVLIVLSADHGASETPGSLAEIGIEAEYFDFNAIDREPGFNRLKEQFGVSKELIANFSQPYLYLNKELIRERGLNELEVERAVAEELVKIRGIAFAVGATELRNGLVGDTLVNRAVEANFHPDRSGDIYIVFEPHWFVADLDGLIVAGSHGAPWPYDSYVPIIVSGPNIEAQRVVRRVETVDLAPTIAAYLGIKAPTGAGGKILLEVFEN